MFRNPLKSNLFTELTEFFGADPGALTIDSRRFSAVHLPNVQRAIERICEQDRGSRRVISYSAVDLLNNSLGNLLVQKAALGPVAYVNVPVGADEDQRCVVGGIHLIEFPGNKVAVHVRDEEHTPDYHLEVMSGSDVFGHAFMQRLWHETRTRSVYKQRVISIEGDDYSRIDPEAYSIVFRDVAGVAREDIVLPEAVMEVIERNTFGFFRHAAILRASGRSVKRGVLLHGPPGTGKTLTAKWIARALDGVTVIFVTGSQLWLVRQICTLARTLSPSVVILEDVDLIAGRRDAGRHPAYESALHELLNEMDGLDREAEVLFLMTTNKPESVEPAVSARPGRIDQAVEFPLPDSACRRQLFDLFGRGMSLQLSRLEEFIARTEGASPAFIQELVRKGAMFAAEANSQANGTLVVRDEHCEAALRELLFGGGDLTRDLLGFKSAQMTLL